MITLQHLKEYADKTNKNFDAYTIITDRFDNRVMETWFGIEISNNKWSWWKALPYRGEVIEDLSTVIAFYEHTYNRNTGVQRGGRISGWKFEDKILQTLG